MQETKYYSAGTGTPIHDDPGLSGIQRNKDTMILVFCTKRRQGTKYMMFPVFRECREPNTGWSGVLGMHRNNDTIILVFCKRR
mmetsp:Transcript_13965/g.32574  ORF Transcript_13965/g.32574 Transcript_13965/m.32574 type:complete len:83 (+) Transcript_13965:1251-1499(+)